MCGLLGVFSRQNFDERRWKVASDMQIHRGPDDQGNWCGKVNNWHIQFGHQRLAILDLSQKGAQPMIHPLTHSVLVFNGEIYNFVELRSELQCAGLTFEGDSDSEVLLQALEHWGIDETLPRLNGMWSFVWLDIRTQKVHMSRDRCGEKPLYLAVRNQNVFFASELKTLLTLLGEQQELNLQVVGQYLEQGLLDVGVETFIAGVEQVRPGTTTTFSLDSETLIQHVHTYWICPVVPDSAFAWEPFIEQLRERFFDSVRMRLRSDVPVGILLSGGLDSSSIAAAAKAMGADNLRFLSAVSDDARFDESQFIDSVVDHIGWPVTKIQLPNHPEKMFEYLEQATWFADAPIGSLSNVAHFMLMKSAKEQGITVVLSGQGADELLCGYRKFLGFYLQELMRQGKYFAGLNILGGFFLNGTVVNQFNWSEAKRYFPAIFRPENGKVFGSAMQAYHSLNVGLTAGATLSERQRLDLTNFSVPALNHFEDRMSMAWSREIRLPFLDPKLIELLIPAPASYKLNKGWTKYALRCAMQPYLPDEIVWRKDKQGFVNPQSEWLKNELRTKITETYFNEDAHIFKLGIIDRDVLLRIYDQFCSQKASQGRIYFREIFSPLALEIWLRQYRSFVVGFE